MKQAEEEQRTWNGHDIKAVTPGKTLERWSSKDSGRPLGVKLKRVRRKKKGRMPKSYLDRGECKSVGNLPGK